MKFTCYLSTKLNEAECKADYENAHEIGSVRIGHMALYVKKLTKVFYVPYVDMDRLFRRVMLVPARMCCGKGDLEVQYIVGMKGEEEVFQIQLPGDQAAKIFLKETKELAPNLIFEAPAKAEGKE